MNETKNKVAFVVVGWNNIKLLKDCFSSILNQTYKNKLIIYIDNASTDGSIEWVKANCPQVKTIRLVKNTGFAKGNNIGIKEALSDPGVQYVSLVNTDCRLEPDWCGVIVQFASQKPKGACYQGTTLDFYNHAVIDSTHIFVARNGQGTQGNWRRYLVHEIGPKKVFGVNAAACMISRSFIETQPYKDEVFDETMYMYLEDVDLAARATVMGWDNYLVPSARAYHMGSVSSRKNPGFSLYMTFRNNSGMLYKNFPLKLLFKIMPNLVRGDIDTIRTLRRLNKKGAISKVIRGRLVGVLRLPLFLPARLKLHKHRNVNSEYLWNLMKDGY